MDFKEQIVVTVAAELRPSLPSHVVTTRCDHGCWEISVRDQSGTSVVECVLDGQDTDKIYIVHRRVYGAARIDVLSDPAWVDRFITETIEYVRSSTSTP